MPESTRKPLYSVLYKSLEAAGFIKGTRFVSFKTYQCSPYMDLVIENIGYWRDLLGRSNQVVSMAHYFVQNGDLMADPDLTLGVNYQRREAYPLSYKCDGMGVYQDVFDEDDQLVAELEDEIGGLIKTFASNIKKQGHLAQGASALKVGVAS